MNNAYRLLVGTAAVLSHWFAPPLAAQDGSAGNADLPAPPFVSIPSDFMQWTMTVSEKKVKPESEVPAQSAGASPSPTPKPVPAIREIVCTKTKDIKRDVITYTSGKKSEVWYYQKYVIVRSPNGEFSVDPARGEDASVFVPRLSTPGFYGLDWIKATNFKSKTKVEGGQEVLIFKDTKQVADTRSTRIFAPSKPVQMAVEAVIDDITRKPLLLREGKDSFVFSYQAPPNSMLAIPNDFQEEVARLQKTQTMIRALDAAGNRP